MKTHVWIINDKQKQFAPIETLVLSVHFYPGEGEDVYLANGIAITGKRWNILKEEIAIRAVQLDNMSRY